MKQRLAILALSVCLAACSPKPAEHSTVILKPSVADNAPAASTGTLPADSVKAPEPEPEHKEAPVAAPAPVSEATIPASLKGDAYDYFGLSNPKEVNVEVEDGSGSPRAGTRKTTLEKVEGSNATFVLHQGGALQSEGDITLSLEPTGIYALSSSIGKIKPHSIEMPAKFAPGSTWTDLTELETPSGNLVLNNKVKVVRNERVGTKAGTFDALLVTSTGSGTLDKKPIKMETQSWYVKGRGPVKQILTVHQSGTTRTVTMQESKP